VVSSENLKVRGHLGGIHVDQRVILKRILKKWGVRMGTAFN
jgi:hypothetical protein